MGYGERSVSTDHSWTGIPGVTSCSALQRQLHDCRVGVAKSGHGHCMEPLQAFLECTRERDAQRASVLTLCGELHGALKACTQESGEGGGCAVEAAAFAKCATAALSKS